MKTRYSFRGGKKEPVAGVPHGKTRITIRLDNDIVEWFRERAHSAGGGNYQTMINDALREYVSRDAEELEETLRRVVREELRGRPEYGAEGETPERHRHPVPDRGRAATFPRDLRPRPEPPEEATMPHSTIG